MTADTFLFHSLVYRDASAALAYLAEGLGFEPAGAYPSDDDPSRIVTRR